MLTLFPRLTPKYVPPPEPEPVKSPLVEPAEVESVTSAEETQEILASVSQSVDAAANEPSPEESRESVAPPTEESGNVYVYVVSDQEQPLTASAAVENTSEDKVVIADSIALPEANVSAVVPSVDTQRKDVSPHHDAPVPDASADSAAEGSAEVPGAEFETQL